MTHTIVTQTKEFVNYDNILRIAMLPLDYEDTTVYALTAQPITVSRISDETLEDCIQLGIYDSEDKTAAVYNDFLKWLEASVQPVFYFPEEVEE